jgi:hypothetical protein
MRNQTREQWIASRMWIVDDATAALRCALESRDWAGVRKYAAQAERAERQAYRAQALGRNRLRREAGQFSWPMTTERQRELVRRGWQFAKVMP